MALITSRDELLHGVSARTLQRRAATDQVERVHRGIYLPDDPSQLADDPERHWKLRLDAHLLRGGPSAALSHRSAARLHGLEAMTQGARHEDITVPLSAGWKTAPAIRSGTLTDGDVIVLDGRRITSIARTLVDLGRFHDADTVEFALEHALRGHDRRRPDVWDAALLADLLRRVEGPNVAGVGPLRVALRRRGAERPSGSFAETALVQLLRAAHISLTRQPTISVVTRRGQKVATYFPDFADFRLGLLIEVDGRAGHEGNEKVERDDRRQNQLVKGFHLHRIHAHRIFREPHLVVQEIIELCQQLSPRPQHWSGIGAVTVDITETGAVLTIR